ncbi:MAG: tetratricopeptide repeat protein [Bacteroidales bacterium]|jgi:tetratricopeptide (TPR) repeat protein|nr:tetratricopeptide repeat protein [Bacteroidales bacterium]MDD4703257.1 tetratricopeptide repeat protein [Bacteroidales bacterium]MDX9797665.1 tetratricopeptide repeat protein [Bacteroidales bacterium]
MKCFRIVFVFVIIFGLISCTQEKKDNKNEIKDELSLLDVKIRQEPKNADLYYARAKVLLDNGNLKESLLDIQTAIDINKKEVRYYIRKADILFTSGETSLAFDALQEALKVNPKSSEVHLKIAEFALLLKDYDKTMFNVNEALKIDKLSSQAYYLRGWTLKEKGDTIHAVESYKKAIELKPDYEEPFEELGLLYALKGDRLAIDYLTSAININPQNLNAMYALGLFYQDHSMMQKALDTYQDIINIEPKHADALHNVGYINLVFKKSYTDALTLFTKAIEADTNFYQAYFNRGITYEHLNDYSKAQADFKKVLEIYPEHKLAKEHLN